ncbi:GNAT family N-acetyltransferase [Acholeplasma hippikon]|uniref:Putative acetyltransferase n=1 Tax=Acholeplasma hippikon TaxID=264636 RepID=A0A449BIV8_9MOLU|nr:GNAT family N-acetyltransferase [Acholeplasma hippikon]VEU82401.1 putative acetyltransferase [Acholeplasma hippikon]
MFINFEKKYLDQIIEIWNQDVYKKTIYNSFTKESFTNKFLMNPFYDNNLFILFVNDDELIGFGHAMYKDKSDETPGFITMIVVKEKYQRQGIGTKILLELENRLKVIANKNYIRQLFMSPVNLEWLIPNKKAYHPGAPAVAFNSPFYLFLINNGFINNGQQQDAFYQDIRQYEKPKKILANNLKNETDGYIITFYDKEQHDGFDDLFTALNNPNWHQVVINNLNKHKPNPMLVIVKDRKILGWTGPLYTEESKRGYFAGIGVHPKCQGRGLGKSLFAELIYQSRLNGAEYMTLFTGHENSARNIYLDAGFKIVQSFAVLRKDIK